MTTFARKQIIQLIGVRIQGDVGPLTIYISQRHKVVYFDKAPPKEPPSPQQRRQLARWSAAARQWRALPSEHRQRWAIAAKRCRLPFSGYSLWIAIRTNHRQTYLPTIERNSGQDLAQTIRSYP